VGSLSHLNAFGLESYTNDLVKTITSVASAVGDGVNVVPCVPVLLGGIDSSFFFHLPLGDAHYVSSGTVYLFFFHTQEVFAQTSFLGFFLLKA
jgi:hypothetical protein